MSETTTIKDLITKTIKTALPDASVYVESPDGTHWQALVVSPAFEGMMLIQQHKLVMNALKTEFDSDRVHALQLKTFTPDKWATSRHEYNISE